MNATEAKRLADLFESRNPKMRDIYTIIRAEALCGHSAVALFNLTPKQKAILIKREYKLTNYYEYVLVRWRGRTRF